ncbi:hypothetical protein ABID47_003234 [Paenibacillus favisporus]|uniref:Uncharacterized protein n=1 Tax=Paenibacillus favisporus TaxID=221028 RepID=A0ABV2F4D1_9BACL
MRISGALSLGAALVCWTAFILLMTTPNLTFSIGQLIRLDPFGFLLIAATLSFLWGIAGLYPGGSRKQMILSFGTMLLNMMLIFCLLYIVFIGRLISEV